MNYWRYGRKRFGVPQQATNVVKHTDPTIPVRIADLLKREDINDWERNFLTSIGASYQKWNSLTDGQNKAFTAIEKRFSAEAVAEREEWEKSWTPEKKANWDTMIAYYGGVNGAGLFKGIVEKAKKTPDMIPSQKEYTRICENVYAKRYFKTLSIPPKFAVGSLAVRHRWGRYELCTIIEVHDVTSWVKGSRQYTINAVGHGAIEQEEERNLLYYRPSLMSKITLSDDAPF